jgi:hypothetical protein
MLVDDGSQGINLGIGEFILWVILQKKSPALSVRSLLYFATARLA